jgi:predicted nucleic acid-binding Zn ribbon protein
MPIYEFKCGVCGVVVESLLSIRESTLPRTHSDLVEGEPCSGELVRQLSTPTLGRPSFEGGAVMSDGSHVRGSWGKANRSQKGWRRP